nr:hypothetical protein [Desulfobacula sp.]
MYQNRSTRLKSTIKGLISFNYHDHQVRTVIVKDEMGESVPWWVAKDVCDVLDIKNVSQALSYLDNDEKEQLGINIINSEVGGRGTLLVSEPGLYSLILRSRKPEAKAFKRWITHEVLPTIRKTGGTYMTDAALERTLTDPDFMIGVLTQLKAIKAERDQAVRTHCKHMKILKQGEKPVLLARNQCA